MLQLLLLTWPVRTVRRLTVFLAFGVGVYGCGVASMLVELVTARQLAASRHESVSAVLDTVSWATAPVAEELIKITPLLLAGWALRGRVQWGLADFAVLGGALGRASACWKSCWCMPGRERRRCPGNPAAGRFQRV
ncbi:hypothetical protein [Streptomyces sp. NBC_00385]|uniref:hypothetical protein n=1 Tax=Streptomyces sp. NBC_00385 TaxID=2975733 RepID=UPI002DDBF5F8|nr:hypothetical protein [Streptomyces sp. NBC_00385]WRZ04568.1 hypothetical protein OG959_14950 [Streptomyces sp. NBC_00385]